MMKNLVTLFLTLLLCIACFAQGEILTNNEIILMMRAGLSKELIVRKIKDSRGNYDTKAQSLIDLKKAGVADDVIELMLDAMKINSNEGITNEANQYSDSQPTQVTIDTFYKSSDPPEPRIVLDSNEALVNAKTIAIKKSSLHPSRQALEKELLKRKEWKDLNLNIVRYKEDADLLVEIGYVSLSWLTHRYVYRIYDNKSGTVIAAGETTSWGSLAENLARGIAKRLAKEMDRSK